MYKTGDIFNCYSNSLMSRLIRKATKSKFSHTAIYIEVWGQPYIIDSQKDGTNLRPFDEWQKMFNYKYEVRRSLDTINEKNFSLRALSKVGHTGYDFEGLLIKQPIELITGRYKKKPNDEERMYCSEFVAWCYCITHAYRMSPQDLYEWQIRNQFYEIICK